MRNKNSYAEIPKKRLTRYKDLVGQRFGRLLVEEYIGHSVKDSKSYWKCKCDCGNECEAEMSSLTGKMIQSCGCLKDKPGPLSRSWTGHGEISRQFFSDIKRNALAKNIPFNLTIEHLWDLFLKQERKCALSGIDLYFSSEPVRTMTTRGDASLDRIDSRLGYIEGNIQWVHKHINIMKNIYSQDYFLGMCKAVSDFSGAKR